MRFRGKSEEDGKTIGKVCLDCWLQKMAFTACEVERDGKVDQTQEVNAKHQGTPAMSALEVDEAEKELVGATLRGPLVGFADKLKGDPGYWLCQFFKLFQ